MAGVFVLDVARSGDPGGDRPAERRRRDRIVPAADDEGRHAGEPRQSRRRIVAAHHFELLVDDRRRLAEIAPEQLVQPLRQRRAIDLAQVVVGEQHPLHRQRRMRRVPIRVGRPSAIIRIVGRVGPAPSAKVHSSDRLRDARRRIQRDRQGDQPAHRVPDHVTAFDPLGVEDGGRICGHPFDRQRAGAARRGAHAAVVEGQHAIPLRQRVDLRAPAVAGDADPLDAQHGGAAAGGLIGERDVVDRQDRTGAVMRA